MNRRNFVRHGVVLSALPLLPGATWNTVRRWTAKPIRALVPRDLTGHQFVLFSDSTLEGEQTPERVTYLLEAYNRGRSQSGQELVTEREIRERFVEKNQTFLDLNDMLKQLEPAPEFIAFPGDAVNSDDVPQQWTYFQRAMAWTEERGIPLYQSTSNHNTCSWAGEKIFREHHPEIPQNGPGDEKGLAFYVREGNLLYISLHHPGGCSDYRGGAYRFDDTAWLETVLSKHEDAEYKLVAAHYPVLRVNGYPSAMSPEERENLWAVFQKHRITAYLTSHDLAYDVRVKEGLLQICSAVASTNYDEEGRRTRAMPGATEYLHAVQVAIDQAGIRLQVLDETGAAKERLSWPFEVPTPASTWSEVEGEWTVSAGEGGSDIHLFEISGLRPPSSPFQSELDLVRGTHEGQPALRIWVDQTANCIMVDLACGPHGMQRWRGPVVDTHDYGSMIDIQLALHPEMGPGGVLWRWDDRSPWSSMVSRSAAGLEALRFPLRLEKITPEIVSGGRTYPRPFELRYHAIPAPSIWS